VLNRAGLRVVVLHQLFIWRSHRICSELWRLTHEFHNGLPYIAPPGRAMPIAVVIEDLLPTDSRTDSALLWFISWTAAIGRSLRVPEGTSPALLGDRTQSNCQYGLYKFILKGNGNRQQGNLHLLLHNPLQTVYVDFSCGRQ
jgi:hypothetical protein